MENDVEHSAKIIEQKIIELTQVLGQEVINVKRLRRICTNGIPNQKPKFREMAWKVLLKYVPPNKSDWDNIQKTASKTYKTLVEKFLPPDKYKDYPIILTKSMSEQEYLVHQKDYELWQQIQKDVVRTRSQINFFSQEIDSRIMIPYLTQPRLQKMKSDNSGTISKSFLQDKKQQRINYIYDYMTRILYVYSKVNPNIGYVQGMNQILAPLFFVVNEHRKPTQIDDTSCFFMFNNLMAQVIDFHMPDMDGTCDGIYGRVSLINDILKIIQPIIWHQLRSKGVDPICYSFKWLALLFAQQFNLFDVCRLWDTLLTHKNIQKFLICLSLAVIQTKASDIYDGDTAQIICAFQQLREQEIMKIIGEGNQIYRMIGKKDLESMVQQNKFLAEEDY